MPVFKCTPILGGMVGATRPVLELVPTEFWPVLAAAYLVVGSAIAAIVRPREITVMVYLCMSVPYEPRRLLFSGHIVLLGALHAL